MPLPVAAVVELTNLEVPVSLATHLLREGVQLLLRHPPDDFQHVDVRIALEDGPGVLSRGAMIVTRDGAEKGGEAVEYGFVGAELVAQLCMEEFAIFGETAFCLPQAALDDPRDSSGSRDNPDDQGEPEQPGVA